MNLHSTAAKYHQWGANIVAMNTTNGDKRPLHHFKTLFTQRQSVTDLETLVTSQKRVSVWPYTTAIALVCGIGGYRMIDIDYSDDQNLVEELAHQLGLPSTYAWTQRSGNGFGIWIRCDETTLPTDFTRTNTPWFIPADDEAVYSHIELRLGQALGVVPPSLHPNGRHYQWLHDTPTSPPHSLDIGTVLHVLHQYGKVDRRPQVVGSMGIKHCAIIKDSIFGPILKQYSLLDIAQRLFPGELKPSGQENVRIVGHGGLIVHNERGWYCFADEIGGGLIDLFGYSLFGSIWDRGQDQVYQARSYAAELFRELP